MKLVPYLSFCGNCEEALNYYKELLNGEITNIMRYGEGPEEMLPDKSMKNKIMHATIVYNGDQEIYFSDIQGEEQKTGSVSLNINIDSEQELERIYEFLSRESREITMPLQKTFWDAKFGSLIDKYGISWSMNYDMKVKQ